MTGCFYKLKRTPLYQHFYHLRRGRKSHTMPKIYWRFFWEKKIQIGSKCWNLQIKWNTEKCELIFLNTLGMFQNKSCFKISIFFRVSNWKGFKPLQTVLVGRHLPSHPTSLLVRTLHIQQASLLLWLCKAVGEGYLDTHLPSALQAAWRNPLHEEKK